MTFLVISGWKGTAVKNFSSLMMSWHIIQSKKEPVYLFSLPESSNSQSSITLKYIHSSAAGIDIITTSTESLKL